MPPTITLEEFLAAPQQMLRKIAASNAVVFITDQGQPILDVRPFRRVPDETLRGSVLSQDDVLTPIEPDGYAASQ